MSECISYAKMFLEESQAFQARPSLYHSVYYRCSVSRDSLAASHLRNRIFHCDLVPYFYRVLEFKGTKGKNIVFGHLK